MRHGATGGAFLVALALRGGAATLDAWVAEGLAASPSVQAARAAWDAARARAAGAGTLPDPKVGAEWIRADTTEFDGYGMVEWSAAQELPGFGKRGSQRGAARLEAEVVGLGYLEARRALRARIVGAYWDLWMAQRREGLAAQSLAWLTPMEAAARARYEAGSGGLAELLRAQSEQARGRAGHESARRETVRARIALNALLGAPAETDRDALALTVVDPPLNGTNVLDFIRQARQFSPDLLALARARAAAAASARAARAQARPDVELRVAARQPRGSGRIAEYDTMIGLSLPLWPAKYRAARRAAEVEQEKARLDYEAAAQALGADVADLHARIEDARGRMDAYEREVLPRARQAVDAAREAYPAGAMGLGDVADAVQAWIEAEDAYLEAKATHGRDLAVFLQCCAPWETEELATELKRGADAAPEGAGTR